jgi:hypothetical protein
MNNGKNLSGREANEPPRGDALRFDPATLSATLFLACFQALSCHLPGYFLPISWG